MVDCSLDTKLVKIKRLSSWVVIKYSLHYFAILSKLKAPLVATIVIATILKNYIKSNTDRIKVSAKNAKSFTALRKVFIRASLFNSYWAGMNFLTDFIFEKQLTQYGGYIATKVLKHVLFTDSRIAHETPGGEFEYYITEGGKAMAKISRMIIFTFLSKLCHFYFGMYNILSLDTTPNKTASIVFITLLGAMSFIKIFKMEKIRQFHNATMDIAFEKEKCLNEIIGSMPVIKAYGTEDHAIVRFGRIAYKWESLNISYKFWSLSTDLLYNILSVTLRPGAAMLVVMMSKSFSPNTRHNSDIIAYMEMLYEMLSTTNSFIKVFSDLKLSLDLTYEIIGYIRKCQEEVSRKLIVGGFEDRIECRDVVYSARDKLIFSGVDFTIHKGDKIALFGRNGTGKSSIFRLILGFDDFKGSLTIDDVAIGRLSMPEYRSLFTYVPQDTKLFDDTIFYNLAFGNNRSYKDIIEECKKMKIHDIIMSFPNGYNTLVGLGGKILNGGLRQKIFYTRAFLCDTDIYMFDEPTNNLDVANSEFLLEYLKDPRFAEKTFFVITHDLAIVKEFPKIFHFDEGKIKMVETV